MAQPPDRDQDSEDLLKRADALLARHRRQTPATGGPDLTQPATAREDAAVPILTDAMNDGGTVADVPLLTDIIDPDIPGVQSDVELQPGRV